MSTPPAPNEFLVLIKSPALINIRWLRPIRSGYHDNSETDRILDDVLMGIDGVEEVVVSRYSADVHLAEHVTTARSVRDQIMALFRCDRYLTDALDRRYGAHGWTVSTV
jgi:hypothetical protein